jgi:hypothetical protein
MIEANISADVKPAARAMKIIAFISCPAPFERLGRGQHVSLGFPDTYGIAILPGVSIGVGNVACAQH